MANSDYSYYFTVVIYPAEFRRLEKLFDVGNIYMSPIHEYKPIEKVNLSTDIIPAKNEWVLYGHKEKKAHQHLLFKTPNKMTANRFIEKISKILDNDFTGISIHKEDVMVQDVSMMLRYFYHLDSPTKEHFNITTAFESVSPCFTKEVVKAFQVEINHIITINILNGNFKTMRDVLEYNSQSLVFEEYMRCTKNLYYINSLFKDERFLKKENERTQIYEKNSNNYCLSDFCN